MDIGKVVECVSSGWMNSGGMLVRILFLLERALISHSGEMFIESILRLSSVKSTRL